jgi:hypothetical protein
MPRIGQIAVINAVAPLDKGGYLIESYIMTLENQKHLSGFKGIINYEPEDWGLNTDDELSGQSRSFADVLIIGLREKVYKLTNDSQVLLAPLNYSALTADSVIVKALLDRYGDGFKKLIQNTEVDDFQRDTDELIKLVEHNIPFKP